MKNTSPKKPNSKAVQRMPLRGIADSKRRGEQSERGGVNVSHYLDELAFVVIPVKDPKKSRDFYERVLGLKAGAQWQDDWIEYGIGSGTIAITKEDERHKAGQHGASIGIEVSEFDRAVACLRDAGVAIKEGPWDSPACFGCIVADPDGNELILHKRK
jgi:catechol 2,3-dioxygenase-like lactoylglutathione lyase family enzyme